MDRRARRFFEELLRTLGPSGHEGPVQDLWRSYVNQEVGKVQRDVHGNQFATLQGRSERSILLAGHADEIGLIVHYIDEDGFLFVRAIGGVDVSILPSQRVTISTTGGHVRGVIGKRAHHLRDKNQEEKSPRLEDLFVDIGATTRAEAQERIEIGDPLVFGHEFETLGGEFATARNFDNRIGCYIVAEALRALAGKKAHPGFTIHGISTVQEETGLMGAGNIAHQLKPSAAVVIDVTHDTHHPGVRRQKHGDVRCGGGPVLTRGVRTNRILFEKLRATAIRAKLPYQVEIDTGFTHTDADPISSQLEGIPVALISIPCRYMHTSCEVIHLGDLQGAVDLLVALARRLDPETDFTMRA